MSGITWLKWALDVQARPHGSHRLTAREHQVLAEVARHAREDRENWPPGIAPPPGASGAAWPSTGRLAKLCGCSRDTINGALRGLEAHGILVTKRRPNRSTVYWFMEAWLSEPSDNHCPACAERPRSSGPSDIRLSEPSDTPLSEPSDTPLSEPSDTEVEGKWKGELPEGTHVAAAHDDEGYEVINGVEITPEWILEHRLVDYKRLVAQAENGGHR